ncbi:MAG: Ig-like domain-containing protein [Oscillospiraceae bacterium]|jgi:hypothetical protein|nr:Ig-like domain-containing protein [Oscillospiraceae bacterium]
MNDREKSEKAKKPHEHHGMESLEKIEMTERNIKRSKWLTRIVVLFLVVVFFGGITLGVRDLTSFEEPEDPPEKVQAELAMQALIEAHVPQSQAQIAAYVQEALQYAAGRGGEIPRLRVDRSFRFEGEDLNSVRFLDPVTHEPMEEKQATRLRAALELIAPKLVEQLNSGYRSQATDFGKPFTGLLWATDFTGVAVQEPGATLHYKTYRCYGHKEDGENVKTCERDQDEKPPLGFKCPDCGSVDTYKRTYLEDYAITVSFADAPPSELAHFRPQTPEELTELLGSSMGDQLRVQYLAPQKITGATFMASIAHGEDPAEPGVIKSCRYSANLELTAALEPVGDLEAVGAFLVTLRLPTVAELTFDYAGVRIKDVEELVLTEGQGEALGIIVTGPENAEYSLRSADEAVATVDGVGNVVAKGENGQSTEIIASVVVNGVTYEDSVALHIREPVERVKLRKRRVTLQPGETLALQVKVTPNNATLKDVAWYSRDEKIATVDAAGKVTAVAPGKVEVYCLTKDGNKKATCTVTVEGGKR